MLIIERTDPIGDFLVQNLTGYVYNRERLYTGPFTGDRLTLFEGRVKEELRALLPDKHKHLADSFTFKLNYRVLQAHVPKKLGIVVQKSVKATIVSALTKATGTKPSARWHRFEGSRCKKCESYVKYRLDVDGIPELTADTYKVFKEGVPDVYKWLCGVSIPGLYKFSNW